MLAITFLKKSPNIWHDIRDIPNILKMITYYTNSDNDCCCMPLEIA